MDYYPSQDYAKGRRYQQALKALRLEHQPEIDRELACLARLARQPEESAHRAVADGVRRLRALDSRLLTAAQHRLLVGYEQLTVTA